MRGYLINSPIFNFFKRVLSNRGWAVPQPGGGLGAMAVGAGALPQTLGRLRRKNVGGASAPRPLSRMGFWAEIQLLVYMIQSSQPVWSAVSHQICLNRVWQVGCEGSRSDPERSEGERSEAEDRSPPSQTGFRQIWRWGGETKLVAWLNHD